MRTLFAFLSLVLLTTCMSQKEKNNDALADFKFPVVEPTASYELFEQGSIFRAVSNYNVLYIGEQKDTIRLKGYHSLKKYFYYLEDGLQYESPDSAEIIIVVDTSNYLPGESWGMHSLRDTLVRTSGPAKAYPVYIKNTTGKILDIGAGGLIPMIMEAKDAKGNWQPIEERFVHMCGTGLSSMFLPPGEIALTTAPVYKGNFKTRMRLNYRGILSNEFSGKTFLSQFEDEYDENGDLKPLPAEFISVTDTL